IGQGAVVNVPTSLTACCAGLGVQSVVTVYSYFEAGTSGGVSLPRTVRVWPESTGFEAQVPADSWTWYLTSYAYLSSSSAIQATSAFLYVIKASGGGTRSGLGQALVVNSKVSLRGLNLNRSTTQ